MSPLLQDIFNFFYLFIFIYPLSSAGKMRFGFRKIIFFFTRNWSCLAFRIIDLKIILKRIFMIFFLLSTFWFGQIPLVCFLKYNTFTQFEGDHFSRPDMSLFAFQVHLVSRLIKSILSSAFVYRLYLLFVLYLDINTVCS